MDCIPYINDIYVEIKILQDVKKGGNCDIQAIDKKINEKEQLLERCKENLSKVSCNKICYRIYLKMLNGLNASKALEEVAQENYHNGIKPTSVSNLWAYYKKMKKMLKQ